MIFIKLYLILIGLFLGSGFVFAKEHQDNCNCSLIKNDSESNLIVENILNPDIERFVVFDNAGSEIPYRIPAIAKNFDGDLIAVADYRYSKADIGMVKNGKLDLRYRIMDGANGEWSDIGTLASAFGEDEDNIAFGDPCIVADRESDIILVISCMGNVSFPKGTHENHQGVARFYSLDGGKSWSEFEDIGNQFLTQLDKRSDGEVRAFFMGSGKITQSKIIKKDKYFRIYGALLVKVQDGTLVNYVFYSDDFGANWNLLGDIDDCPVPYGADEPKVEELPNGDIVISSRISGGRAVNIFHFNDLLEATGKWDEMTVSNNEVNGIIASANACNGELLLVPVINNVTKAKEYLLLQSVPMDENGKRAKVGINYKILSDPTDYANSIELAKNWDGHYVVTPESSAYSTMVLDKNNDIAFFFEENGYNGGYDMVLSILSIEEITNGLFSFSLEEV